MNQNGEEVFSFSFSDRIKLVIEESISGIRKKGNLGASFAKDRLSRISISQRRDPWLRAGGNCLVILAESCRVSSLISAAHGRRQL